MSKDSRPVSSNQDDIHKDLETRLKKHLTNLYKKPYRPFSGELFRRTDEIVKEKNLPIILDSGCGTGKSSQILSEQNKDKLVIGIDKSEKRLEGFLEEDNFYHDNNLILLRADVVDIWRMAEQSQWNVEKHYLLYPNPWPKKDQLNRRWHGHPVFPQMLNLCDQIELRTNWQIYAEEFLVALEFVYDKSVSLETLTNIDSFISPFEEKYYESGHELYRVTTS